MNLSINDSYGPYAYLVLLQIALVFMQRLDLNRRFSSRQSHFDSVRSPKEIYCLITGLLASVLAWSSWALALYVGYRFGVASGLLFFIVGVASNLACILAFRAPTRLELVAHVMSFPATALLFRAALVSLGIHTTF
jgi:hypothetical protein